MYQLGELINSSGLEGHVYRIKGKEKLIAKVFLDRSIEEIEKEFEIGKMFQKNNISVPKFIGVCKVKRNNDSEIYDAIIMEVIEGAFLIRDNIPVGGVSQQIENTNSQEYIEGKKLLEIEMKKFNQLSIKLVGKGECGIDCQGLYSPSKKKIYLIDFGQMIIKENI